MEKQIRWLKGCCAIARQLSSVGHLGYFSTMQKKLRRLACFVALAAFHALAIPDAALSADKPTASRSAPRVVNIRSDSVPGWTPSEDLERQARKTATDFMAHMDSGRAADAYAFLTDLQRKDAPFSTFSNDLRKFNASAGSVVERRITYVTWTKDPPNAPGPGVYVALDLVSRFAKIDRHCGFLVLHQAPSGGPFRVTARENNSMPNDVAAIMAKRSSAAAVDRAWAKHATQYCPNYQLPRGAQR